MSTHLEKILNEEDQVIKAGVLQQQSDAPTNFAAIIGDLLKNQQLNETGYRELRDKFNKKFQRSARKRLLIQVVFLILTKTRKV